MAGRPADTRHVRVVVRMHRTYDRWLRVTEELLEVQNRGGQEIRKKQTLLYDAQPSVRFYQPRGMRWQKLGQCTGACFASSCRR